MKTLDTSSPSNQCSAKLEKSCCPQNSVNIPLACRFLILASWLILSICIMPSTAACLVQRARGMPAPSGRGTHGWGMHPQGFQAFAEVDFREVGGLKKPT